ncbi:MAG: insulinase family protein [Sedimentisphaerales bacterium]|nr:insulinase family protein [Sedimentisphaerales bacterium]
MEFRQKRLSNGLMVIGERMPAARSLAMGFFVRTGARDETAPVAGVSHFLEHMMFKGTPTRSALEVNRQFDAMGAKYNAFTSEENTVYYAAVLPEYQRQVLDLWADLMRPSLREEDFEVEKGVICEEIAMYKDQPHFDVVDRCRRLHFGGHGCGNSVLGSVESIQALTAERMREYFTRRYAPDNMVLAAAGRIDWEVLVGQAEELCGGWTPSGADRTLEDFRGTTRRQFHQKDIVREHLCLMSPGPPAQDERRYAAGLLANVMGDVTGSRLYWRLVDTALADAAEMDYEGMDGTGLFCTYISCDPKRTAKVMREAESCLKKIRAEGISQAELEVSKNKIASTATLNGELPMGRLVPLGYHWLYRKEYRSLAEDIAAIRAVKRQDVIRLLNEYPLEKYTVQGLGQSRDFI